MSHSSTNIRIAVTLGDPAGIGAEIILKALSDPEVYNSCDITIFGSKWVLDQNYQQLTSINNHLINPEQLRVIDIPTDQGITFGVGNALSGAASFKYLHEAIMATKEGHFHGIVTAPIAKSCWQAAGYPYPGQTEVLAGFCDVNRYGMLFVGESPHTGWTLRTLLATTHIPLVQVSTTLTPELMSLKLDILLNSLEQDFHLVNPTIAVAGLNPHSGEQGRLGMEEQEWLIPWLEQQKHQYPQVKFLGPVPPDTLWVKAGQAWYTDATLGDVDAYIALYHDQGLIPVKLMAFDVAVNTTIGLPFIRTSPDHGTAFDIVGRGIANPQSFKASIHQACAISSRRKDKAISKRQQV